MNMQSLNKFLCVVLSLCIGSSACQNSCILIEEEMKELLKTEIILEESEKIYDEYTSLDCADMLFAYNFIGFAHYNTSNLQLAKEYLIKGEKVYLDNKSSGENFANNQLYTSLIYILEKDYETALYHLNKAETYANKTTNNNLKSSVSQNLGLIMVEMNELLKAEHYYNKAIDIGNLDSVDIGYVYQNMAFIYLKKENHEKSEEYIKKTKLIWTNLNYSKGIYLLSFIESKLAIKKKEYTTALNYLNIGRAEYTADRRILKGENYLIEAKAHGHLGNTKAKLLALENAILESEDLLPEQLKNTITEISNSLNQSRTKTVLINLISQLKYQSSNQNKITTIRNKMMDSEKAEDEFIIKMQLKYMLSLGLFSLIILGFFLRIRRQKKKIQSLNKNLALSNNKIENQLNNLTQKNKELEKFAFVASHDLKSPLRTISSFAEIVKRIADKEKSDIYLDIISDSAKNMTDMITALLEYSTLDQQLTIQHVNLMHLIEDTIKRIDSQIAESNTTIILNENCDHNFECDKTLFSCVIQNLISNAIIYCKDDIPPEITISAIKKDNDLLIKFSDNGIGIEEEYKAQIFEMFKRLKTNNADGTGIGLATCMKIVEKHNGTITVDSTFGVGSNFTIKIPLTLSTLIQNSFLKNNFF